MPAVIPALRTASLRTWQAASREEHSRILTALSEECGEGIMVCDAKQRIVFVNSAFECITGFSRLEALGRTPRMLQSGQQSRDFYAHLWQELQHSGHWRGEICNRRKSGELYSEWLSIAALRNAGNVITHYTGVFFDLTQRRHAEDQGRELTSFDPLTQLPNRSMLAARLGEMLTAATKAGHKVVLLLLDLERFKSINDSLGHEAGDVLLQTMAGRLSRLMRHFDIVARLGGHEFAIACPSISNRADADWIARKVLAEIARPLLLGDQEIQISGCAGICLYPDDAHSVSEMLRHADTAMYRAKGLGRDSRQFYSQAMSQQARASLDKESALRRALRQEEFELHYQPQIDLGSGAILSIEALIRWNRPGAGLVMPNEFIALAEELGLISDIGAWTLAAAADQAVKWDQAGLPPFTIAVNLSATQFHGADVVGRTAQVLQSRQLAAQRIEFEITEGIILHDAEGTIDILQQLHRFGVLLSIDDFGTGYSSLNYLRRFPIDKIKIDRSFIAEMTKDQSAAGVVRGIIELAHGLGLQVVAEGVETRQQMQMLRQLRCDRVQGYFISRPLPLAQFEAFVASWPQHRDEILG